MGGDYGKFAGGSGAGKFNDYVLPFQLEASGARGRLIRLGPVVDEILNRHAYPEQVLLLLGEAVTLTAMLGAALKFDGKFILQTQSNGPVSFLVVHYSSPGHVRGYASYNREELAGDERRGAGEAASRRRPSRHDHRPRRGHGTLPGHCRACRRYAWWTPRTNISTSRSRSRPSFASLSRATLLPATAKPGQWSWRAGGLMVQKLTREGGRQDSDDLSAAQCSRRGR